MEQPTLEQYEHLRKRHEQLVAKGAAMRVAQNDYFRAKGPITLEAAKKLEREFDKLVRAEVQSLKSRQQDLF